LTVLDPPTNAKVAPPTVASRFAVSLAHEVAGRSATAGSASSVLGIQQEEHRDDRRGGDFSRFLPVYTGNGDPRHGLYLAEQATVRAADGSSTSLPAGRRPSRPKPPRPFAAR
jgi:hypothetical protein